MSDCWIRKMRTYFLRLDFDKDGVISRKDFEDMGERMCFPEEASSVQKERARQLFSDLFSQYTMAAGKKDGVLLTEELLIESMKKQRDTPEFKKTIRDALTNLFFNTMDVNHDGYVQLEEYQRYFLNFDMVDTNFTKGAFDTFDVNHDGKLSFEEFMNAVYDYMCSDAENTEAMFGLLV